MPTGGQQGTFRVDVSKGLAKLKAVLAEIDPRDLLATIGERQKTAMGLVLQSAGTTGGEGRWQTMAPVTLEKRPRDPPYKFWGEYQQLLQQSPVAEVRGTNEVAVGTNAKYSAYHHFGARRGGWTLPARPLLPTPQTAADVAVDVLKAVVAQVAAKGRA